MDDPDINDEIQPSVFGEDDDDPFPVPPPLAPLPSLGDGTAAEDIQAENGVLNLDGENEASLQDKQKNKIKRKASRPRVNLNEARLCSEKGIAALKNLCADVKFQGKGHEVSDLNKLLQQFEHWAQCLMPSWPFENVVRKCEKLGTKRSVQNELKRLRRDEDDVLRGDTDDEHDEPAGEGETTTTNGEQQEQQEIEAQQPEMPVYLTEEQLERIRKNRELAFARREALRKRKQLEESQNQTTTEVPETAGELDSSNSQHRNFVDTCGTNLNDEDSDGSHTATERQKMDKSSNEEHNQNSLDKNNITVGSVIDQMDTDNTNMGNSADEPTENKRPTDKSKSNIADTATDSINEINTKTSETPFENSFSPEKSCTLNGEDESLDMATDDAIAQMVEDATDVELPGDFKRTSKKESNAHNNKKERSHIPVVSDKTELKVAVTGETLEVLTAKHKVTEYPNLEGETKFQDIVADGTEQIDLDTAAITDKASTEQKPN